MKATRMRAAIYARVSTKAKAECPACGKKVRLLEREHEYTFRPHQNRDYRPCRGGGQAIAADADRGQDTENQLLELREYSKRQGWTIVREYVDRETAKHGERDAFRDLFADASKRQFDVVLVWALDRFTREGVLETFEYVRTLTRNGVQFESYSEQHFRTTGPAGELMLAIAAWIAKQERLRISERTKAGLARARREGKHCGRPSRVFRRDEAAQLRSSGMSWRAVAKALNLPLSTVVDGVRKVSPPAA